MSSSVRREIFYPEDDAAAGPEATGEDAGDEHLPGPDASETAVQGLKVFVGGVPAHMSDIDLANIFRDYGPLIKAWVQKSRYPVPEHFVNEVHCGFGFLIFRKKSSVDQLLGLSSSCRIPLPNGQQLEVKRVLSKIWSSAEELDAFGWLSDFNED